MKTIDVKSCAVHGTLLVSLCLVGGTARALTVNLCAGEFIKMVAGQPVTMWGYALGEATGGVCDSMPTVPGPEIRVPDTELNLAINLTNTLDVSTSLVIPGQAMPDGSAPVFFTDANGNSRVRSFTTEAPAGGAATYTWSNFKAGTYVYHSGTQPSLQPPMGLYGAIIKDARLNEAYPGINYDDEIVLFYSEIASALHDPPTPARPLTYHPDFYLINGEPYVDGVTTPISAGNAGQTTLIRMINMGIEQHLAVFQELYVDVIAEDGNLYPFPRTEHTVMLAPIKTRDVLITPNTDGIHAIYDAAMGLSNDGTSPGGMLAFLEFGASSSTTEAVNDAYVTNEDTPLNVAVPGVLINDANAVEAILINDVPSGTLTLNLNGSFDYTPAANFNGNAAFTYKASTDSNTATTTITVNPVNDAPLADPNGPYTANVNVPLSLNGTGSSDVDGDTLTYRWDFEYDGVTFIAEATGATPTHTYTTAGTFTVALIVNDGTVDSTIATTTAEVTVGANISPTANDDFAEMNKVTVNTNACLADPAIRLTINVTGNDTDLDGAIDTSSVVITQPPNKGGAAMFIGSGNVYYCPKKNFKGQEIFSYTVNDNAGATSNEADVNINVLK